VHSKKLTVEGKVETIVYMIYLALVNAKYPNLTDYAENSPNK